MGYKKSRSVMKKDSDVETRKTDAGVMGVKKNERHERCIKLHLVICQMTSCIAFTTWVVA